VIVFKTASRLRDIWSYRSKQVSTASKLGRLGSEARQRRGGLRSLAVAAQHIGTINNWYEETHIVVIGSSPPMLTILSLSYCPVRSLIYIFAYVFVTVNTRVRIGCAPQLRCLGLAIFWNQVVAKSEGVRPLIQKMWGVRPRPPKVTPLYVTSWVHASGKINILEKRYSDNSACRIDSETCWLSTFSSQNINYSFVLHFRYRFKTTHYETSSHRYVCFRLCVLSTSLHHIATVATRCSWGSETY